MILAVLAGAIKSSEVRLKCGGDSMAVSQEVKPQKPWWNRPLIGNKSLVERVFGLRQRLKKETVPENAVRLHQHHSTTIKRLLSRAYAIDNDKFGNQEFLTFVRMKRELAQAHSGYQDLDTYIDLLMAGINAKAAFLGLETIEFGHCSTKQSEFYAFVDSLYPAHQPPVEFIDCVQQKYTQILPALRTAEGRTALQSYFKYLRTVANHPLSFKLLCSFKQHRLTDFSILKKISEIIDRLQRVDLLDRAYLSTETLAHYDVFAKMAQVIGLPDHLNNTKAYGILLQYAALSEKYKLAYPKFQELSALLQQWHESYQALQQLQKEYVNRAYRYPKTWKQAIPGVGLYEKYQAYFN
ncbi:MAG: hypothetical protein WA902_15445 [Thermosynechococcaceae cyanobacterium]